jgi:hypothetical protein
MKLAEPYYTVQVCDANVAASSNVAWTKNKTLYSPHHILPLSRLDAFLLR